MGEERGYMPTDLPTRILGDTGLEVTQLGFGAMVLWGSYRDISDEQAGRLLNAILDSGITFIDTSPDYGVSEDRIGKHISHRRDAFYLATKCGCNIDPDAVPLDPDHLWTGDRLRRNIDQSLRRMKTDHVDVLQMHNPPVEDVEKGGLVEVLQEIRASGKTRFIGVSSPTGPDLLEFVRMGVFDTFQIPYSALERRHEGLIQEAADAGAGIIIRGGIARGHLGGERWAKWGRAQLTDLLDGMSRYEFVLRFTLTHPSCHTTIVGTADLEHLRSNTAAAQAGPLPSDVYDQVKKRLDKIGEGPE